MSADPLHLTSGELERLRLAINDWSIANGLTVRPSASTIRDEADPHAIVATAAPITLFPSPFPEVCFTQAQAVQRAYNELYARVSQDEDFLGGIVRELGEGDDFILNLWQVHVRVEQEGYAQPLSLGLFRSDYMVHHPRPDSHPPCVKQVEFNTISASFAGLSAQTSTLHKFLANTEYPLLTNFPADDQLRLPENDSVKGLASGLKAAFVAYGESTSGRDKCILFIVQPGERNLIDQRHVEYHLLHSSVPVFRLPCTHILSHTTISKSPQRTLLYQLPYNSAKLFEVAVVYFRSSYGPEDHTTASDWEARYHLERSAAIKCPSILTQLSGAKKVQQVLATPATNGGPSPALGRFIRPDSPDFDAVLATFAKIYPMDTSPAGQHARNLALDPTHCQKYVLKPQREGGGHNVYRGTIPVHLRSIPEAHWTNYVLMELITPPPLHNVLLRAGVATKGGVICELGIYGTCLWNHKTRAILHNEKGGYLLRTKGAQSEEGGVARGYGCMDSCSLVRG